MVIESSPSPKLPRSGSWPGTRGSPCRWTKSRRRRRASGERYSCAVLWTVVQPPW